MTGRNWSEEVNRRIAAKEHRVQLECARDHRAHWAVIQRRGNASAFNGYHWTPSDYSSVRCHAPGCGRVWRTKAAYVSTLPDEADYLRAQGEQADPEGNSNGNV